MADNSCICLHTSDMEQVDTTHTLLNSETNVNYCIAKEEQCINWKDMKYIKNINRIYNI